MAGASVNKVILLGNLGQDPELRYTGNGKPVATFTIATSERGRAGSEGRTEWHRIVVWDRLAEQCSQYLSKGRQVYIEGRPQTRSWEDRNGQRRQTTEVVANTVQFLGSSRGGGGGGGGEGFPPPPDADDYSASSWSGKKASNQLRIWFGLRSPRAAYLLQRHLLGPLVSRRKARATAGGTRQGPAI